MSVGCRPFEFGSRRWDDTADKKGEKHGDERLCIHMPLRRVEAGAGKGSHSGFEQQTVARDGGVTHNLAEAAHAASRIKGGLCSCWDIPTRSHAGSKNDCGDTEGAHEDRGEGRRHRAAVHQRVRPWRPCNNTLQGTKNALGREFVDAAPHRTRRLATRR